MTTTQKFPPLLEHGAGGEEVAEAERGPVAEAVPELRVPTVDQELHLNYFILSARIFKNSLTKIEQANF